MATKKHEQVFNSDYIYKLVHNCSIGFDGVQFCWHGGEPLLVGIDFYQSIIAAQNLEKSKRSIKYSNSVQSNGTLINNEHLLFFSKNNFRLGLSLDAPPDINLLHRGVNAQQIVNVVIQMRKFNMPANFICVVSKLNVAKGKEIFEFFKLINADSYSFLPLRSMPRENCPEEPTNQELFELYRDTFELWAYTENSIQSIEPIKLMVQSILGKRPYTCSFASSCLKKMITIDAMGNVIPCSSLTETEFVLGNIFNEPLIQILANESTNKYKNIRSESLNINCRECEFISICRGGCRADAYWRSGGYSGVYPYCEARKKTFAYFKSRLKSVMSEV